MDLQELADRLAIMELTSRYCRAADDGDLETFADLYAENGEFVARDSVIVGGDAVARFQGTFLAEYARHALRLVHMTLNPIITVDGDRATHTCTMLIAVARQDRTRLAVASTGRYTDELVRTAAGWRFRRRTAIGDVHFWKPSGDGFVFDLPGLSDA
jgi:uncharacterized protein (TIGR02246 family)